MTPVLSEVAIFLGLTSTATAAVVATLAALRQRGRMVERHLLDSVAPLGLSAKGTAMGGLARATGTVDGIDVRVRYYQPQRPDVDRTAITPLAYLRVELELPGRMPQGQRVLSQGVAQELLIGLGAQDLQLGEGCLDARLRVATRDEGATRALLLNPTVASALRSLTGNARVTLDLNGTSLSVRENARLALYPRPTVEAALSLASALVSAFDNPWILVATKLGLSLAGARTAGLRGLSGTVRGVPVKVSLGTARDEPDQPQTRVVATIDPPLVGELRCRGRAKGATASGLRTGHPVLDALIDIHATDLAVARRVLCDDDVVDPLLEIVHGRPGSYVHPRGVVLVAPGWLQTDLEAAINSVVELVSALQGRSALEQGCNSRI